MDNWFTVESIDADTFAISEYKHWEEPHCYLLCGKEKALLIDAGLGVADLKQVVDSLTSLPVTAAVTHVHWDHIGGLHGFPSFAVPEEEKSWVMGDFPLSLETVKRNLTCRPCQFPRDFDLQNYGIFQGKPQWTFRDRDSFSLGGRTIIALHTPGHSPGHCCFYEPERKYLYSGDLIYCGTLDAFYPTTDPVLFRQSVHSLLSCEIRRILPGHHTLSVPVDLIRQIDQAFCRLFQAGKGKQGSGVFDFGAFQIHL